MDQPLDCMFNNGVWSPVLESFGGVAQLTVALYGADAQMVCGPLSATPLFAAFQEYGYDPGLFPECAQACLAQASDLGSPVVRTRPSGLSVVGVSLVRQGQVIGAIVAGYAQVNYCDSVAIERLARECGAPFRTLWAVARRQTPVSTSRLVLYGALLRVLGDTVLREDDLRRQSQATARQLTHLASHDALTDLPNRLLLADRLGRALAMARRHQRRVAVLFLDIDGFKHINDSLGHLVGDELLRTIGRDVTGCVRSSDTVGRHGGDELVVVLAEVADAEDAATSAEKIMARLGRPHHIAGHDLRITVSIGISVFPDDGEDTKTLLMRADMALYHAKELGRDGYRFFEPNLNVRAVERQSIEAALHRALDDGEFALVYQPKIDLRSRRVIGVEALIRWRHPERGGIPPDKFIPIAEHCGLIRPIGRWVAREACRQAQAWQDLGFPIPVSVNVSAVEFRSQGFLTQIGDILAETRLDPRALELEITESVLMANVETTTAVLHALKGVGVQLAVDDFGTGSSSLSYLRQFPIDALKIDRSFVQEITSTSTAAPIVSAVIGLGRNLKLRVIAEGIETREQLVFLQAEACGEGQGYYFSRPLAPEQFAGVLETGIPAS